MRIFSSKSGLGLPAVLAIILFVISSTVIVITSVYGSSIAIEGDYKANQEYVNAQNSIDIAANIIIREENLTESFLSGLSAYMDVTISVYNEDVYTISKVLSNDRTVSSYISGSQSAVTTYSLNDTLFNSTGLENDYEHNVLLQPASILSSYLEVFMPDTFPDLGYNESFNDFDSIFAYFETLTDSGTTYTKISPNTLSNMSNPTVGGHWYVAGNLTIADRDYLIIPDGYVLFIDGNLQMGKDSVIYGNLVVNGDVYIKSKRNLGELIGTVYTAGSFSTDDIFYLGYYNRPSFIFADQEVFLKKVVYDYGFIYSSVSITVNRRRADISIYGGTYAPITVNLDSYEVAAYYLDQEDLYDYGVPKEVSIIDTSGGTSGYFYTSPK